MTNVSSLAFTKITLHAAKFPYTTVNGLLLGKNTENSMEIVDVLPLFHSNSNVSVMMEVALEQGQMVASKRHLQLLGLYQANRNQDVNPTPTTKSVINGIVARQGFGMVLMIAGTLPDLEFVPYLKDGSNWSQQKPLSLSYSKPPSHLVAKLHDFDEYLDSTDNDWIGNPAIKE